MPTIDRTTLAAYHDSSGARIRKTARYVGPSSYATGGESFLPADLGMTRLDVLLFGVAWDGAAAIRVIVWDRTNNRVLWFVPDTGVQVAATTNLSGFATFFEAIGI